MRHTLPLFSSWLGGADIQMAEDLKGIVIDDFARKRFGEK